MIGANAISGRVKHSYGETNMSQYQNQDVICHVSQCHITKSYLHVRCDVGKMLLNTYMMWNDNAWMQRSLKNADPPKPLISPMQENMCFFPRAAEP